MWILLLTLFFIGVDSVDRSNFKTCKESSFCTRQRDYWPTESVFSVDKSSVLLHENKAFLQILNIHSEKRLNLTITHHTGSVFRVVIDEAAPIRQRFRTRAGIDSLAREPELLTFKTVSTQSELVVSDRNDKTAVVTFNPFKITFYTKNNPEVTINERNLLHFEHHLEKQFVQPEQEEEKTTASEKEEEKATILKKSVEKKLDEGAHEAVVATPDDATSSQEEVVPQPETTALPPTPVPVDWAEYFKGHKDSRPHGPASVGVDVNFNGYDYVYGIPEHADSFVLRNTNKTDPYRLFNLDVFEYELNNPMALYGSVPVLWAHKKTGTVGIFVNNPSEGWVDVDSNKNVESGGILSKLPNLFSKSEKVESFVKTRWMFETGVLDLFVILADSPQAGLKSYTLLTGTTPLPPLATLGNHQCRWNYKDQSDVKSVNDNYDKYLLPMDYLWLDIEHSDGKRYLTWDKTNFPNPNEMVDDLTSKGRHLVAVVDPHIKQDSGWSTYSDGKNNGLYIKFAGDNADFDGWCWPGSSAWPDFYRPEVANWWSNLFSDEKFLSTSKQFQAWNDMNEPSVFSGPEVTVPKDVKHGNEGEWENRDLHNLYGLWVHQASWDGLLRRTNYQERPFVLTRAFFAGSQRTSTIWTGDNTASWEHLQITTPMLLSLSVAGITFCGSDVGGFFGHPSGELYTRWYQAAAFHPFLRSHAHIDTPRREPWNYDKHYLSAIQDALRLRYSFLPYWYTLFARAEIEGGLAPMAPLLHQFPTDEATFTIEDEFMVGEALLVHPVVHEGATSVSAYLPKGTWYLYGDWRMFRGEQTISVSVDIDTIPFFYRGGFIIPKKERPRRSSATMLHDPYTFIVSLEAGADNATGYIYYDDFHSTSRAGARFYRVDYRNGVFALTLEKLSNISMASDGFEASVPDIERIVFVGVAAKPKRAYIFNDADQSKREVEFLYSPWDGADRPGLLVVRKPEVKAMDGWRLHIIA